MTHAQTVHDELTRIADIVTAARGLVSDGQMINLAPLEAEVTRICGELDGLSGAEAQTLKPILLSLMDDLDALARLMREKQSAFEKELRSLTSHRSASKAYNSRAKAAASKK
ncbi:MAG TPA: hypothetical protein VLA37_05180 [Sphingomonadaceae bacterium]|nr:hypothetical protein [Sphingomonadaceae bacterium]